MHGIRRRKVQAEWSMFSDFPVVGFAELSDRCLIDVWGSFSVVLLTDIKTVRVYCTASDRWVKSAGLQSPGLFDSRGRTVNWQSRDWNHPDQLHLWPPACRWWICRLVAPPAGVLNSRPRLFWSNRDCQFVAQSNAPPPKWLKLQRTLVMSQTRWNLFCVEVTLEIAQVLTATHALCVRVNRIEDRFDPDVSHQLVVPCLANTSWKSLVTPRLISKLAVSRHGKHESGVVLRARLVELEVSCLGIFPQIYFAESMD